MSHNSKVQDTETHFIIDPLTRSITNSSSANNTIVQYDHNSERFTFDIPRYVDGHDMSESNEVRVHYLNSASTGLTKTPGVYICNDLKISDEDENLVTFSWLLSSATTQYIGSLYFSIQFVCFDGEILDYAWNTGIYKDIIIIESINNTEEVVIDPSSDVLEAWRIAILEEAMASVEQSKAYAASAANDAEIARQFAGNTENIEARISRNSKRITNLEKGISPDPFYTDDTTAHAKIVPANALPYAEVTKIGGMTYRDESTNTLRDAKVTAIESVGVNVSDISSLSTGYFFDNGGQPTPTDRAGYLRFYVPKVRPNTTYSFTTNLPIYSIWEDDGVNPTQIHTYYHTTPQKATFTTDSTCKRLRISVRDNNQIGVSALEWCMLNVGDTALPYVPYDPNANKTLDLPSALQELEGYGLGVSDTYHNYIDWETKTYVQEVKKYDLSKIGFSIGGDGMFYYCGKLKDTIKTNLLVSSHYVKATQNQAVNLLDGEILIASGELYLKNSSITSASQIVGEAVFVLATPIITDISDILPDDNFIEVVGNGSVYAVNEKSDAVPTEITYMLKEEA